jgi:hypothetical protein
MVEAFSQLLFSFFLLLFINNFGVYSDKAFHLAKIELVFECLDDSTMTLNLEKITISFSEG